METIALDDGKHKNC